MFLYSRRSLLNPAEKFPHLWYHLQIHCINIFSCCAMLISNMNNLNCYLHTIQWVTSTKNVGFGWNGFFFLSVLNRYNTTLQLEINVTKASVCCYLDSMPPEVCSFLHFYSDWNTVVVIFFCFTEHIRCDNANGTQLDQFVYIRQFTQNKRLASLSFTRLWQSASLI